VKGQKIDLCRNGRWSYDVPQKEEKANMRRFQLIQGGKGGGKEPVDTRPMLYKAYSISNLTRGTTIYYDVRFNWYCLERDQPPFPYEEIIAGYARLDAKEKTVWEREAKRFFTEKEIEDLESYLNERYGMNLTAEKVPLPIEERGYLFEEGSSVVYDFLELSEREGYSLPFKVWGYYTLEHCLASPTLENGVSFLLKAFERLQIAPNFSHAQLEAVSKILHDEEGLFVQTRKDDG
jgi:hypothetical protein